MKVTVQGKEIEIKNATEEQMSLDYLTPVDLIEDENLNLENTIEITEDMQKEINGEQNG